MSFVIRWIRENPFGQRSRRVLRKTKDASGKYDCCFHLSFGWLSSTGSFNKVLLWPMEWRGNDGHPTRPKRRDTHWLHIHHPKHQTASYNTYYVEEEHVVTPHGQRGNEEVNRLCFLSTKDLCSSTNALLINAHPNETTLWGGSDAAVLEVLPRSQTLVIWSRSFLFNNLFMSITIKKRRLSFQPRKRLKGEGESRVM